MATYILWFQQPEVYERFDDGMHVRARNAYTIFKSRNDGAAAKKVVNELDRYSAKLDGKEHKAKATRLAKCVSVAM